jgi:hypothetical protein
MNPLRRVLNLLSSLLEVPCKIVGSESHKCLDEKDHRLDCHLRILPSHNRTLQEQSQENDLPGMVFYDGCCQPD